MAPKPLKSHTISFPGAPPVTVEIVTDLLRTFTPLNVFAPFLLATTFSPLTAGISRLSEAPPSPPLSAPKQRVRGGREAATKTIKQLGGPSLSPNSRFQEFLHPRRILKRAEAAALSPS